MLPYIVVGFVILSIIVAALNAIVQLIEVWNGDFGTNHDAGLHDNRNEPENNDK